MGVVREAAWYRNVPLRAELDNPVIHRRDVDFAKLSEKRFLIDDEPCFVMQDSYYGAVLIRHERHLGLCRPLGDTGIRGYDRYLVYLLCYHGVGMVS